MGLEGLFRTPDIPGAPTPPTRETDPAIGEAARRRRRQFALAGGRRRTILGGAAGGAGVLGRRTLAGG